MTKERSVPRYQKIFLDLREKILSGELTQGTRISSEAQLSEEYGVSRITSQRALNELAKAGLVIREKGRGTLVRENILSKPAAKSAVDSGPSVTDEFIGQSRIIGQSEIGLLTFAKQAASPQVLERLSLEPASDVYHIERTRSTDGSPFCYVHAYVPVSIGRTFSPAALESKMLIDLISETGHQIGNAEQTVTASIADENVAGHLEIRKGTAILYMERTVYDTNGTPIEYATASFRPDKFRLSMSLATDAPAIAKGRKQRAAVGK